MTFLSMGCRMNCRKTLVEVWNLKVLEREECKTLLAKHLIILMDMSDIELVCWQLSSR